MKALVTNRKVDGPTKERRKLDQKLEKALEENFPGSDPISICPSGLGRAAMVNGANEHVAPEGPRKVTCPKCSTEAELMDANDFFAYKLICPVLRDHLARRCPDNGIDCPHMGPVMRIAVLQNRRGKRKRQG